MDPGKRRNENTAPTFIGSTHGPVTNQTQTMMDERHTNNADIAGPGIGHNVEVCRHNHAKLRIVPQRMERCERDLLTVIIDVYELTN